MSKAFAVVLTLLLGMLLVPAAPHAARADDEVAAPPLELRLFHVGALTAGVIDYIGMRPPPLGPDDVSDEDDPLFGAECEEPTYAVGQVDELIELVQGAVDPAGWATIDGAQLRSLGEDVIVGKAPRAMLDGVARYLADAERRVLRTARLEVRAFALPPDRPPPADAAGWATLPRGPGVSLVAFDGQRATAFAGRQLAYVQDYDVEVAEERDESDPIVSVANLGFILDAAVHLGADDGRALVQLRAHLVELEALRRVGTGARRPVDAPTFARTDVTAVVEVPEGVWTPVGRGAGDWVVCVRATPGGFEAPPAPARPLALAVGSDGPLALRTFDVADLMTDVHPWTIRENVLLPSNFTLPVPPERPEPRPACPAGALVDLIFAASAGEAWWDPAALEARNGRLIARNRVATLDGLEGMLAALRDDLLWSVTTTAEVVDLPATLARRLTGEGGGAFVVDADARAALEGALRGGEAQALGRLEVIGHDGPRNGATHGRHVTYLQDYEVEIAKGSGASNPVFRSYVAGLGMEVAAHRMSGDRAVALELRFQQTEDAGPLRDLETPHGPIDLPDLAMLRARTGLVVPLGGTVLVAARGDGDRERVVLLTVAPRPRR